MFDQTSFWNIKTNLFVTVQHHFQLPRDRSVLCDVQKVKVTELDKKFAADVIKVKLQNLLGS